MQKINHSQNSFLSVFFISFFSRVLRWNWRRWFLWLLLTILMLVMLVMMVYLARRFEINQMQNQLDHDLLEITSNIRHRLNRDLHSVQMLPDDLNLSANIQNTKPNSKQNDKNNFKESPLSKSSQANPQNEKHTKLNNKSKNIFDQKINDSNIDLNIKSNIKLNNGLNNENNINKGLNDVQQLITENHEILRIEKRDFDLSLLSYLDSPHQKSLFEHYIQMPQTNDIQSSKTIASYQENKRTFSEFDPKNKNNSNGNHSNNFRHLNPENNPKMQIGSNDLILACTNAKHLNAPVYSGSYFVPRSNSSGIEVIDLCIPILKESKISGYWVVTYSLPQILLDLAAPALKQNQEITFNEIDGTRLAVWGFAKRSKLLFTSQHLLDLSGNTLMLRLNSWHSVPSIFPSVMTALVTGLSIALLSVLIMLVKDNRLRLIAERDLADALAFRKAMEDSLVTGLRARDLQGRITYVNPAFCEMVGFSADELLGHEQPAPYWPPEWVSEYERRQAIRLAGHAPPREGFESMFMHKNGRRFPVLIIEAPLINAQGHQTGWMSAFLNISEQRRIEEQSRASFERLQATARLASVGEMASSISHELNQPLAVISSYATGSLNLLKDFNESNDAEKNRQKNENNHEIQGLPLSDKDFLLQDLKQAFQRISEQAERAGRVIKSVRDFVRRREQKHEKVSVAELWEAIMPLLNLQAQKLSVRIEFKADNPHKKSKNDSNLPLLLCDRTMIEQVLLNLARNAMQAMSETPIESRVMRLQARLAASNEHCTWLELAVEDLGSGISEEVAKQLFTPFFTTKAEGMGLGLSLCRTVIEQHGGHLWFENLKPSGTIFKFTLPVAK